MFLGHYGVGLGTKKAAPVSLGLLFMAVQFLDLLWPAFLLSGVEHAAINTTPGTKMPLVFTDYPYSHSLLMAIVWSILFGGVYWMIKGNTKYAFILGLCVISHWLLDFIVHIPDLPLYPGASSPKVGLGLWQSPLIEFLLEVVMFLIGLILYLRTTKAKNRTGSIVFWVLIILLVVSSLANYFSPPPSSISSVAWTAELMWLFVILGFWADRNRVFISR
jgi:hypothetical protein